jgi:hypothetical protein
VDLIEEQDGARAAALEPPRGLVDDLADAFDADGCGVLTLEVAARVGGDKFGERGLAGARGTVEDERCDGIGLEHPPQELALAEDVALAGELVESARAHSRRERLDAAERRLASWSPEV